MEGNTQAFPDGVRQPVRGGSGEDGRGVLPDTGLDAEGRALPAYRDESGRSGEPSPSNALSENERSSGGLRDPWEEAGEASVVLSGTDAERNDPDEVTVQLDSPHRTTGRRGDGPDASDAPVFVDETGRRGRTFRRIGITVGLACAAYAVVIVGTLLSGNAGAPWLPVPGQKGDEPAGRVDTSGEPSSSVTPTPPGFAAPGLPGFTASGPASLPSGTGATPSASGSAAVPPSMPAAAPRPPLPSASGRPSPVLSSDPPAPVPSTPAASPPPLPEPTPPVTVESTPPPPQPSPAGGAGPVVAGGASDPVTTGSGSASGSGEETGTAAASGADPGAGSSPQPGPSPSPSASSGSSSGPGDAPDTAGASDTVAS
ncbi:translation initiation factor IF-2 [Streptomyces galilaeus]|uniref:translation initiation factor IF-2 n=1 Tax=Streptomyces galilaeus TaxID=33899 RepID=UPI0038F71849